jgi:hypothetical protein
MEMTAQSFYILIIGLIIVVLIIVLLRKNIKKFDLKLLKGVLTFSGETHKSERITNNNENEAKKILKWVQENINKINGDFILTDTTTENAQIAARLYSKIRGEIISTCFFEDPDYGNGDFANTISPGTNFHRITLNSLCSLDKKDGLINRLAKYECNANLVVISNEAEITKIAGIFCKLTDKSYLAFIALNSYGPNKKNKGLTFTGDIAQILFEYYNSFI